jgi:hypothetical protein
MKSMRILGLALVAVFALFAMSVASASAAEPAFYECVKEAGGKFAKGCATEGGKGGYVLREGIGAKPAFKGKGGKATLHTPGVGEVTCASFKDSGTITSPTTEGKVLSTFSKCESLGKTCTSPGAKAGTITTNNLKGSLGYLSKANHEAGVDLSAETGSVLAEFTCEGLSISVTGSVIGQITPVNIATKKSTTTFAVTPEGFQKYKSFEGGPEDVLESTINGSGPFESGQEASALNKGGALLLKA